MFCIGLHSCHHTASLPRRNDTYLVHIERKINQVQHSGITHLLKGIIFPNTFYIEDRLSLQCSASFFATPLNHLHSFLKTQSSASTGTFAAVVTSSIKPLVVGTTVSLSASGALQTGGGTTIYRNVGPISASACPKFLSATPVYDDKFLVSYADGKSGQASISVMQVNSSRLGSVLASTQTTRSDLYHVVTLNQATGLFVTISQDDSLGGTPNTALIAGRSDSKNSYAITFGASAVYDQGSFSVDPTITPLSNSSFVIAYYNTSLTFAYSLVYARYGAYSLLKS